MEASLQSGSQPSVQHFIASKEPNRLQFSREYGFFFALQLVSRLLFLLATYLVSWWDLSVPNCMLTLDLLTWVSVSSDRLL